LSNRSSVEQIKEKDKILGEREAKIDQLHDDLGKTRLDLDVKEKEVKQVKHDLKQVELLVGMSSGSASLGVNAAGTMNPKQEARTLRQDKSKLQQQLESERKGTFKLRSELDERTQEIADLKASKFEVFPFLM